MLLTATKSDNARKVPHRPKAASEEERRQRNRERQRQSVAKKLANGQCEACGQPRNLYPQRCDTCQQKAVKRIRKRRGGQPWHPYGPGRPPKTAVPCSP